MRQKGRPYHNHRERKWGSHAGGGRWERRGGSKDSSGDRQKSIPTKNVRESPITTPQLINLRGTSCTRRRKKDQNKGNWLRKSSTPISNCPFVDPSHERRGKGERRKDRWETTSLRTAHRGEIRPSTAISGGAESLSTVEADDQTKGEGPTFGKARGKNDLPDGTTGKKSQRCASEITPVPKTQKKGWKKGVEKGKKMGKKKTVGKRGEFPRVTGAWHD